MNDLVIIGGGRAGRFANTLAASCNVNVIGFLDDTFCVGELIDQVKVLGGTQDILKIADTTECQFFISITSKKVRRDLYNRIREYGLELLTIIHPSVVVYPGAHIGEGVLIQPFCTIQTGAVINHNVIIEEMCAIGVDVNIGCHSVIAPGVSLTGGAKVGEDCFIGTNSCINPEVTMRNGSVLGSGSTLISDTEELGVYAGAPAKKIK